MAKLKLNLPNGSVEEKNLLTAFKNNDKSYIVFDADSVGSMGLPIILVCKYDNNRVIKINDANEWTEVKGALKEIITGTSKEYFSLPESLDVDETYYTQLTLPVASFEAIKKAYVPSLENVAPAGSESTIENTPLPVSDVALTENVADSNPLVNETISTPEAPTIDPVPSVEDNSIMNTDNNTQSVENDFPTIETSQPTPESVALENPVVENPAIDPVPSVEEDVPKIEPVPVASEPVVSNEPIVDVSPVVNDVVTPEVAPQPEEVSVTPTPPTNIPVDASTSDARERFIKACGEAFDALLEAINKN